MGQKYFSHFPTTYVRNIFLSDEYLARHTQVRLDLEVKSYK
jgi:hypothetical protein